jgi:16S rRNA (cytosine967-C5)-methyltransferase
VELAPKRQRSVINGVLRSAARRQSELLTRAATQPLFVRKSHPEFLVARWQQRFDTKNTEELCSWNNEPPPVYGRINRLKIERGEFLRTYPEARPLGDNPDFVEFHTFPIDSLNRGHCYIQDPSTVIACQLLDPQPGESILDACAAPGGKTAYIAELMKNQGVIATCDRDPERIQILQDNIARLRVGIVHSFSLDWTLGRIPKKIASLAPFDRILIDAPCSNTGVMRRRVDVRWRLRPEDFIRMSDQQFEIARSVINLLKPGGILVYSTCSLEREENEQLVERLLKAFAQGLRFERDESCLPFRDHFDGAFAARLANIGQIERRP